MKRVIFIVLLLIISVLCTAQNLVVNPGFEVWTKINKPAGWSTAQLCLKDSVNILSGNYSCRHEGTSSATKSVGQKIPVLQGKQYSLSFFYKTVVTGSDHGCRIWCHWEDAANKTISDPATDDILEPSAYMKSETWLQFSIEITSPANSSYFILEVRTYQNSVAFFDDFDFEENVATINDERSEPKPLIYPNPAHDYLIINNIQNIQYISIQNVNGITLWKSKFSGDEMVTIPVSGLAKGLYIVIIRTPGRLISKKFVKCPD